MSTLEEREALAETLMRLSEDHGRDDEDFNNQNAQMMDSYE